MTKEELLAKIVGQRIVKVEAGTWQEEQQWFADLGDGDNLTIHLENGVVLRPLDVVDVSGHQPRPERRPA